jgi:hypothetical protein
MSQTSDDRPTRHEARDALTSVQARSRAAAARLPDRAPWYEAIWTAYVGGLVLALALPTPFEFLAVGALVFGLGHAMRTYQDRYGVWVSGFRAGRTRLVALALAAVLVTVMAAVWILRQRYGMVWPAAPGAVVAMLVGFVLNRSWMRAYRSETGTA